MLSIPPAVLHDSFCPLLFCPFELSILSLRGVCRSLRGVWVQDISEAEFFAYLRAVGKAIVVHPATISPPALSQVIQPEINALWQHSHLTITSVAPCVASATVLVQFTFAHGLIHQYFHGTHWGDPQLVSTSYKVGAVINNEHDEHFMDLYAEVFEDVENGNHGLIIPAHPLVDLDKPIHQMVSVDAVFFGTAVADQENWRSSHAAEWSGIPSAIIWPGNPLPAHQTTWVKNPSLTHVLEMAERSQEDFVICAFVNINAAAKRCWCCCSPIERLSVDGLSDPGFVVS